MTQEVDAPQTQWLDSDQQRIWRAFLGGTSALFDRLDRDLREHHNLSMPEYEILVRLSEAPDRTLRMAELADAVSQSRSRTTHTIARLENAGIVARSASPDDGRGVLAHLTSAGFDRLRTAAHTHVNGVREYLVDAIGPEDLDAVGRAFEVVRRNLHGKPF